jgi:hypothetical protein
MFSYRQVICNRGTLNGRILRFGGRTGVLRSSYQVALQVAALHIGALHIGALHIALQIPVLQINALQINDRDQFFSLDSAAGLGHSLQPVRTCSAASNVNLPFACKPCCWMANLLTSLFAAVTESHLWPPCPQCAPHIQIRRFHESIRTFWFAVILTLGALGQLAGVAYRRVPCKGDSTYLTK